MKYSYSIFFYLSYTQSYYKVNGMWHYYLCSIKMIEGVLDFQNYIFDHDNVIKHLYRTYFLQMYVWEQFLFDYFFPELLNICNLPNLILHSIIFNFTKGCHYHLLYQHILYLYLFLLYYTFLLLFHDTNNHTHEFHNDL